MRNIIIAAMAAAVLTACDKYDLKGFFVSPSDNVEVRYEESSRMAEPEDIDIMERESYNIVCCGDIHYRESAEKLRKMLRESRSGESKPLFAIINGDLTDRKGGLDSVHRIIEEETRQGEEPHVFTAVGNHDLYFNQWERYKELFGRSHYSFAVRTKSATDLFICLDTGNATLGRRQREWLEKLLHDTRSGYRHCTIFTHTNLWLSDYSQFPSGSMPTQETMYLAGLAAKYDVGLFIQSHDHTRDERTMEGVRYVVMDAMKDEGEKGSYLEVQYDNGIEYRYKDI